MPGIEFKVVVSRSCEESLSESVAAGLSSQSAIPLCVDLDGTLVKSDTLFDSLCQYARRGPRAFWDVLRWAAHGRAALKTHVANQAPLHPAHLPYNTPLLHFLEQERKNGRAIYLTTGAEQTLAERVAAHLGLFKGVLATNGDTNLTASRKLQRVQQDFAAFDYVGNSRADLVLLTHAQNAMVANPTLGLRIGLWMRSIRIASVFQDRRPPWQALLKAFRVHQWAKNVLLAMPFLMTHNFTGRGLIALVAAFFSFSFIASANYLVNDMLDIESDRQHRSKRLRPFAAGDLSVLHGLGAAVVLVVAALALLPFLPLLFALWLGLYVCLTAAYSFSLKKVAVVDVLLLSSLYTLRLLAGGAATGTVISPWLGGLSTFLFLSLAMVKRFSELENLREQGATEAHGRGYLVDDIEQIRSFGTASAYAAVLVFMLYIARPDVTVLYRHPARLWLIVPLMLYWLQRVWLLAARGELDEDPVVFAMKDPPSLLIGAAVVAMSILAAY